MTEAATQEQTQAAADMAELKEAAALAELSVGNTTDAAPSSVPLVAVLQSPSPTAADGGQAKPAGELSPEDRLRRQRERARRQRENGSKELKREYVGAMTVTQTLKVNDPNVASSAIRFLALTDKTLYLLKTMGSRMMSEEQSSTVREALVTKIREYCAESKKAVDAASALLGDNRAADFDWITPKYCSAALSETFETKDRTVFPLIEAINNWDSAIAIINELEFNGKASFKQVDELRVKERRMFADINYFCYQVVMSMMRKFATPATS